MPKMWWVSSSQPKFTNRADICAFWNGCLHKISVHDLPLLCHRDPSERLGSLSDSSDGGRPGYRMAYYAQSTGGECWHIFPDEVHNSSKLTLFAFCWKITSWAAAIHAASQVGRGGHVDCLYCFFVFIYLLPGYLVYNAIRSPCVCVSSSKLLHLSQMPREAHLGLTGLEWNMLR